MILRRALVAALVLSSAPAPALADDDPPVPGERSEPKGGGSPAGSAGRAGGEAPRGVDVDDLPPLPDPTELSDAGDVAVAAASAVEEDVVVGAAKREQSLGNVASAVTVISGDRLRRFGYRTVSEAVRGVAGVYIVDDHMTDRVGIRGLQVLGDFNSRILVLVDGATVNEPWGQFAGVDWDAPVSIDDVARIEVIRGPVSSLYGTNAFFGIINIVTRGADQSPRAWGRLSGTSNLGHGLSAGFATGTVDRQVRASISADERGGESLSADGIGDDLSRDVDGSRALNASVVGVYDGAFAQVRFYRRERTLPFAPYGTIVDDDRNQNTDTQILVEGGYNRTINDQVTLTGRVYASRYQFTDRLAYEAEVTGDPDDIFRDVGDSTWGGAEVRGRWDVVDKGRLGVTAGGEVTRIDTDSRSFYEGAEDETVAVPKKFSIAGLYAEVDGKPLPWFAFVGGVRRDFHSLLENRTSPRAALFFSRKDKIGLKLLYAEGFRNPSPYEGFFEDGIDFIANPNIKAETIRSYEVVLWGRPISGVSARVSGFRWEADKIVEQDLDPGGSGLLQFQNLGALTSTGVEVEASYRDARGWLGFGGFTVEVVRGAKDEATGDLPKVAGAPAITATLGVSTPLIKKLAHVSTEVQFLGARPTRVPGVTADPWVGWNVAIYFPDVHDFDVTIAARNLIGIRDQTPAQEDYDRDQRVPVLPGEGREIHARVGYRF